MLPHGTDADTVTAMAVENRTATSSPGSASGGTRQGLRAVPSPQVPVRRFSTVKRLWPQQVRLCTDTQGREGCALLVAALSAAKIILAALWSPKAYSTCGLDTWGCHA